MLYSKGPQVEMNFVDEQELMGIREVWRDNFEKEIRILMEKIEKYNYIAMVKQAVSGNIEEEGALHWLGNRTRSSLESNMPRRSIPQAVETHL